MYILQENGYRYYQPRSEDSIVFSSARLCVCVCVCVFVDNY